MPTVYTNPLFTVAPLFPHCNDMTVKIYPTVPQNENSRPQKTPT